MGVFFVNAQSANPNWTISKDVQRVANKDRFAEEELRNSFFEVKTADFPSFVISKGVFRKETVEATGNIESKNTNDWVVSKGVHRIHKK